MMQTVRQKRLRKARKKKVKDICSQISASYHQTVMNEIKALKDKKGSGIQDVINILEYYAAASKALKDGTLIQLTGNPVAPMDVDKLTKDGIRIII